METYFTNKGREECCGRPVIISKFRIQKNKTITHKIYSMVFCDDMWVVRAGQCDACKKIFIRSVKINQ